jgi:hypothetical protein
MRVIVILFYIRRKRRGIKPGLRNKRKIENTKKSMSHLKYQTIINGTEIAALLIWEVNPYTSSLGNSIVAR